MLEVIVLLYVGGSLAVAAACASIYADPEKRRLLHQKLSGRQAGLHAVMLSLLWPGVFLVLAFWPNLLTPNAHR